MSAQETTITLDQNQVFRFGYWGALGLGAVLLLVGFNGNYTLQVSACFLGIVARVVQAEFHYESGRRQRPE